MYGSFLSFLLVELAVAERDYKNAGVSFSSPFFRKSDANGRPYSQAFLTETVVTGDKNRHDFHCMQMSLVMSMQFSCGDHWNIGIKLITFVFAVWQWCNFSSNGGPWSSCNYARVLKIKYYVEYSTVDSLDKVERDNIIAGKFCFVVYWGVTFLTILSQLLESTVK